MWKNTMHRIDKDVAFYLTLLDEDDASSSSVGYKWPTLYIMYKNTDIAHEIRAPPPLTQMIY